MINRTFLLYQIYNTIFYDVFYFHILFRITFLFSFFQVVPIFAISERRACPKISIFTYPDIHSVSKCVYKKEERRTGFLSSEFAGTDYLLTLSFSPNFQLIIWLWRTGEYLSSINTEILDDFQHIS